MIRIITSEQKRDYERLKEREEGIFKDIAKIRSQVRHEEQRKLHEERAHHLDRYYETEQSHRDEITSLEKIIDKQRDRITKLTIEIDKLQGIKTKRS